MGNIFDQEKLYPYEGAIKEHFEDHYDSIFIAFLPFFQLDREETDKSNLKKAKLLSHEEALKKIDFLKNLPEANRDIYNYDNERYPSDEDIFREAKAIPWKNIVNGSTLTGCAELNTALRTSIGGLNRNFTRPDLMEKLNNYTDRESIYHPTEGAFGMLSKMAIHKAFKLLGKNQIMITDEFYENTTTVDLDQLTEYEFCDEIGGKDYYLYSADKEILFTIEWDSFFFLIATDHKKMDQLIASDLFEGFLCNDKTEHYWEYTVEI
ncbi:DUF2711 family protein [Sphingobacterium sp. HMA12]|uniref:DUF2711 family protein n=1 Tax=Sphingobacterium sp. HMA12 TaxID=2050894 RepID=UPI000CE9C5D0|nr:DUF2711 family protein [Sphingobacterium sp. HMA12]